MALSTIRRMTGYVGLARDAYRLRRADDEQVQELARRHLIQRMGKLRGLPQKLGQMLSFSHGQDDVSAEDFSALNESAQPLPVDAVRPLLTTAWGGPPEQFVKHFDPSAKAASLGQVHAATMHDGRRVAVKVQYPGIRDAVMADLKMFGWLSVPLGGLRRGFDLASYRQVVLEDIERELDYRQEAENQRRFSEWADNEPRLAVPRVVDELSTDKVLVSAWEDGDDWKTVQREWSQEDRAKLAETLLALFLEGLFSRGLLHADWHPGNLRFRRIGGRVQLLLYDFGCVHKPSEEERLTLLRLIQATADRDDSPMPLLLKMGFQGEYLQPLSANLPALCRILFEPFCVDYAYDMPDWRLGERVGDILGDDRWNFRIAGPPSAIFLLRAFHGLMYYMEGLPAPVRWRRLLDPYLSRHRKAMNALELPEAVGDEGSFATLATVMKIRVTENGRTKVELTTLAASIDHLQDLLDEETTQRIQQRGIDLSAVTADVRRRGYAPGPVFDMTEGAKQIAVWLQ